MSRNRLAAGILLGVAGFAALVCSQSPHVAAQQIGPVNGMRPTDLRTHAIVNATVVTAPGETIQHATILIRDGVIQAVGSDVQVPDDAWVWPAEGLTVYPGLIDAAVLIQPSEMPRGGGAHWNSRIRPELSMADQPGPDASLRKDLRSLGFTTAAVYPASGAWRGSGVVIALADDDQYVLVYRHRAAMAAGFDYGRGDYPGSLMGAIALLRQTLLDAQWHAAARAVWDAYPDSNEPPLRADALTALHDVITGTQPVLFEISHEHNALRAARLASEFNLRMILLGSGMEFRRLSEILATDLPIILPLDFPKRPDVSTIAQAESHSLRDLMTWEQAPTNPRRLLQGGATVALTTHKLRSRSAFHENLRNAIKHGLTEEQALAALTTTPAALLELDHIMGTIEPGKIANLVVVKGSLFEKEGKIRDVWINGRRHEISREADIQIKGSGTLTTDRGDTCTIELDSTKPAATLYINENQKVKAAKVLVQRDQLSILIDGRPFAVEGYVRLTGVLEGTPPNAIIGTGVLPNGQTFTFSVHMTPNEEEEKNNQQTQDLPQNNRANDDSDGGDAAAKRRRSGESNHNVTDDFVMPPEELNTPFGEYGLPSPPVQQDVLVTNATIWTCSHAGILENGWMLVRNGRIAGIGRGKPPTVNDDDTVLVIDATGKHVTPGLIDCHSHTGIDGGVNEFAQTNTAEVRIGDCIDPDDINWYRQLAGGLTAANQLHGSANPIGGQNSVVKLKWGGSADDFRIPDAIAGIKFALGENVKRSQNRYPNTRMGVETFIRDAFTAARDYKARWDRYNALPDDERARTMPPRRDLELDALVEILEGKRIIHCHSYRQDEILMLIRLAEDFGFTIGTFQHVLEGYKVADAIASHGAGGSSFSDWWAYKVEVMDAIPFNGSLMHNVGVLVSFNSDSSELARRLNTEAAKAVRYGGMEPHEALKFVTINPAKQLRIDHRTGSLEVHKDADFVIWSGDPLSAYSRCEQTWIEGARYFDLESDLEMRASVDRERQRIIQKILAQAHGEPKKPDDESSSKAGNEEKNQPNADSSDAAPPQQLLARMMQEHLAWMEEQVRLGRDPYELRPGDCGCNDFWSYVLQAQQAGGAQ